MKFKKKITDLLVFSFCAILLSHTFLQDHAFSRGALGAANSEKEIIEYSQDSETIILSLDRRPDGLVIKDETPFLRVYGDGRVVIHYHQFHKKTGDYTLQLSQSEFMKLLSSLNLNGIIKLDDKERKNLRANISSIKKAQRESLRLGQILTYRSSDTTTEIEIILDAYKPEGLGHKKSENIARKIRWYGIQTDAKLYPALQPLQNLANAEKELIALSKHKNLKKVKP